MKIRFMHFYHIIKVTDDGKASCRLILLHGRNIRFYLRTAGESFALFTLLNRKESLEADQLTTRSTGANLSVQLKVQFYGIADDGYGRDPAGLYFMRPGAEGARNSQADEPYPDAPWKAEAPTK